MAGRIKNMSQIKQLLILLEQGKGKKTIARIVGMSKNTVKEYLSKLEVLVGDSAGLTISDLLKLENPELEAKFHSGNPAYKSDERYETFKEQFPYLLKELQKRGVTRHLLWQEYIEQHPNGYRYSQFCFHLQQQRLVARANMVLEHQAGDKLFIDFAGGKLAYTDPRTGEVISCEVFVATLPFSDYGFAMAVPSQQIFDFIYALECCLRSIGGVPSALVPDNLKSGVIKAGRYEPTLNQALADFATHYGTAVIPTRVRKPQDKALVENQVKLVYSRVFAKLRNTQFFDLASLNEAIAEKMKAHNQSRMQQKPYCRQEQFLAKEKPALRPLPIERFELKTYKQLKVAKNNHIYLCENKHYYSVPHRYIGKKVKVIYNRNMVYVYYNGKQIAVHIRSYEPGGYSTSEEHLCPAHKHYKDRSPDYYKQLAKNQSQELYFLVDALFKQADKHPEQLYRTCDGLVSLSRKSAQEGFKRACLTALENGVYSYEFIKNYLSNKMNQLIESPSTPPVPTHQNIRGKEYYELLTTNLTHHNKNESDESITNTNEPNEASWYGAGLPKTGRNQKTSRTIFR